MVTTYRIRMIRVEHLHLVVLATGRRSPHILAGRRTRCAFVHQVAVVAVLLGAAIPSAQIAVEERARLLQKCASPVRPVGRIAVAVDLLGNDFHI